MSLIKYRTETARIFQLMIRLEAADRRGLCSCVTCGAEGHYKEMEAGHCVPGRTGAILFDERNVGVQCVGCNRYKSGNRPMFNAYVILKHGAHALVELERLKRTIKQFTMTELMTMRQGYRDRIKAAKARLGEL